MATIVHSLFGLRRRLVIPICSSLLLFAPMTANAESKIKPHPGGFWKVHPPTNFKGEFDGQDPIGLAFKQHIPTDCSIVWKDGQKFYCFSSQMSSQFVQENPGNYLPQATAFWAKEHPPQSKDAEPGSTAAPPTGSPTR